MKMSQTYYVSATLLSGDKELVKVQNVPVTEKSERRAENQYRYWVRHSGISSKDVKASVTLVPETTNAPDPLRTHSPVNGCGQGVKCFPEPEREAADADTDSATVPGLDILHQLFQSQVERDNIQFDIQSVYIPNPIFTVTPKYCLIAMEPSMGRITPKEFQAQVNQGFKNFLYSEMDFILHYCAYTFLCDKSFAYQITDISKGAMKTKIASIQRKMRYANWLEILKQELEFFGNPRLATIGYSAKYFVGNKGLKEQFSLTHFSPQNSRIFRLYYERHSKKSLVDDIHVVLKEFATNILGAQNYGAELKTRILGRLFKNELSVWKRGLFLNYMDQFSSDFPTKAQM
jgi:hypothetical protein